MSWISVRNLLDELANAINGRSDALSSEFGEQALLEDLLALDSETRPAIDSAIHALSLGAQLPALTGREYFMLELRIIHAMTYPVVMSLDHSIANRPFVSSPEECGYTDLDAVYWLLVDIWRVKAKTQLEEFAESVCRTAPNTQTHSC